MLQWAVLLIGRSLPELKSSGMAAHHSCQQVMSNAQLPGHKGQCLVSLHTAASAQDTTSECASGGKAAAVVIQFQLSFLNFLVDCQRPWGLISHLWVSLPPQDLAICCTAPCPGKAMLASIPLPKILQCLFWFLQIVLALTPHTVTTDSRSHWSPLSDSKVCIIFASLQPYTSTFCLIILSNLLMWPL